LLYSFVKKFYASLVCGFAAKQTPIDERFVAGITGELICMYQQIRDVYTALTAAFMSSQLAIYKNQLSVSATDYAEPQDYLITTVHPKTGHEGPEVE
jgi:hypothetical protein